MQPSPSRHLPVSQRTSLAVLVQRGDDRREATDGDVRRQDEHRLEAGRVRWATARP